MAGIDQNGVIKEDEGLVHKQADFCQIPVYALEVLFAADKHHFVINQMDGLTINDLIFHS